MKKTTVKILSLALAVVFAMAMLSVGAFAYSDDYVTVNMPETFLEEEWATMDDSGYVNVYYEEVYFENGKEYYTYNSVDLYVELTGLFTSGELEDYYNDETLETVEFYAAGDIKSSEYYYTEMCGEKAIAFDVYYEEVYSDTDGAVIRETSLLSEVICVKDGCVITADIVIANGSEDLIAERDRLVSVINSAITLNADVISESTGVLNTSLIFAIGIIIFIVLIPVFVVVLVVVIVKNSKKKKQQQAQQQYTPYGYNPNGYNQYGQQPPVNNQYNPYNQQNNGGYTPTGYSSSDYNPYSQEQSNNNEE